MSKTYFFVDDKNFNRRAIVVIDGNTIGWTTEDNPDYLAWLAEGNEPQEWQPEETN